MYEPILFPLLSEIALKTISHHMAKGEVEGYPEVWAQVPSRHRAYLSEHLPTTMPLTLIANLVDDQQYWERVALSRWGIGIKIRVRDNNYRQLVLEKHLEEVVEGYVFEGVDKRVSLPSQSNTESPSLDSTTTTTTTALRDLNIDGTGALEKIKRGGNVADAADALLAGMSGLTSGTSGDSNVISAATSAGDLGLPRAFTDGDAPQDGESGEPTTDDAVGSRGGGSEEVIEEYGWDKICGSAKVFAPHVTRLTLKKTPGNPPLASLLAVLPHLTDLDCTFTSGELGMQFTWKNLGMNPGSCDTLCGGLATLKSLEVLRLSGSLITDAFCKSICKVMVKNNLKLKKLSLAHNQIGNSGARSVARVISSLPVLERVDLTDNRIGGEGAAALGVALGRTQSLKHLNLSLNRITPQGMASVTAGLPSNTSLTYLSLGFNCGDSTAVSAICQGVKAHGRLEVLVLSGNKLGAGGSGDKLLALIAATPSLRVVDCAACDLGDEESAIQAALGARSIKENVILGVSADHCTFQDDLEAMLAL